MSTLPRRTLNYPKDVCVYCGAFAETRDHLLPISWTGTTARRSVPTVPSCSWCNFALGDLLEPDVRARRDFAHDRLRERYKRQLTARDFTDEEILTHDSTLVVALLAARVFKKQLNERLAWPEDLSYDTNAESEVEKPASTPQTPEQLRASREGGLKGAHVSHHVRAGVIKEGCKFCEQ